MFILLFLIPLFAIATPVTLTEKGLIELANKSSPRLSEIKTQLLRAIKDNKTEREQYAPEFYAGGSYAETQERAIIEFIPVFSPLKTAFTGLRQKYSNGLEAQLQLTTDQRSASAPLAGSFRDVTTNILSFTLQMDIWKNLFGALSEAELKKTELTSKGAQIQEAINRKALELSVRRLYWALVANTEQLKIAARLLSDSGEQLADARKRLAKSVSDSGDVARYEALVAQRKGQTIFFNYQREILFRNLKTLLPELNQNELLLDNYDIEQTIKNVSECALVITTAQNVPWDYTRYDEVVSYLREIRSINKGINQRHDAVDVKLYGTVKSTGIGSDEISENKFRGSYGRAFEDMQDNNRSGYEVGLNVTIPLGNAREETRNTKILYDEERLKAQIEGSNAQILSTHTELSKSIRLIGEVIESQKASTRALEKRLKVIRRKYQQARASVNDLLLDQEALLNSELSTVDAQLQALNVLFDYLMIFTETPCTFNRI